jgi:hypothetical protein
MTTRWNKEQDEKYFYSKENLLELFIINDEVIPENFTSFEGITLEKAVEPVNKSNAFKITTSTVYSFFEFLTFSRK